MEERTEISQNNYRVETILWMVITALVVFILSSIYYRNISSKEYSVRYYTVPEGSSSSPENGEYNVKYYPLSLKSISSSGDDFNKFKKVYDIVKNDFLNDYDIEKVEEGAINGMLEALGDPYSNYFNKNQAENFLISTTEGEYEGIGVYLSFDLEKNLAIVLTPIKGSPAEEAGIKAGDYIISINNNDVTSSSLEEIAGLVRGKNGTSINVKLRRYGESGEFSEFEKEVERRSIDLNPFEYKIIENDIGYIKFTSFDDRVYDQFTNAMSQMKNKISGLIIDLRDNPGGILTSAQKIIDEIIPAGIITYDVDKNGKKEYIYSDSKCFSIPVTVIVNGNSASASEITAAAIKDWDKGAIVGTTTFGKGTIQALKSLGDGTYVKVTIAEYFSPSGNKINKIGVPPDYEIEDNKETEADEQLLKAIEVVRDYIKLKK